MAADGAGGGLAAGPALGALMRSGGIGAPSGGAPQAPQMATPALPASYQPPAMQTFAPTDPMFGPSYGWSFPAAAALPPGFRNHQRGDGFSNQLPQAPMIRTPDGGPNGPLWQPGSGGKNARGGAIGKAGGGEATPWFEKREAAEVYHDSGLVHSTVAGRTDRIPLSVAAGAYVLPADVVSGLGEGNTLSGAKVLDAMMHSGPFGMKTAPGRTADRMPSPPPAAAAKASGGRTSGENVPIIVAGGEYVIHPRDVAKWSRKGDVSEGHDSLDKFVRAVRAHTVKQTKKLPGPRKD